MLRVFLLLCLCLFSCTKKEAPAVPDVRLNLKAEPATLDPRKGGDIISSHMHFLFFEGLMRLNPDHSLSCAQAESYERSSDGLVYTFKLRRTLWSNGMPVVASDFEKAWKAVLSPQFPSPNAHLFYSIKNAEKAKKGQVGLDEVGIKSINSYTLQVVLERPTPYFLELISFCSFFPVCSSIDAQDPKWAYDAGEHFVCNGPFLLESWKHHDALVAVRNPAYWNHRATRPERIYFSMVGDETTALHLFEKGELDMLGDPLSPLPVEAVCSLKEKWGVHKYPIGATTFVTFNINRFPFTNVKIRKAFGLAIDRASIVANILQTDETPSLCAVPPILKHYGPSSSFLLDAAFQEGQELFKQGLEELGLTQENFPKLTYFYSHSDKHHRVAQALQEEWRKSLGVEVAIEGLDQKILMDRFIKREYAFGQAVWAAQYNDPMNILERFRLEENPKNYPGWYDPDYAKLLEGSFYVEGRERQCLLEQAEGVLIDQMPLSPLYHWDQTYVLRSSLSHVEMSPIGDLVFHVLSNSN